MPKIRIYLEKKIIKDEKILLNENQIHYLKNVMRKQNNDSIFAFDSVSEWKCSINLSEDKFLIPLELLRLSSPIDDIWICFSLIKRKNIKNIIEKVTEIGVKKIIPMITEYSEKFCISVDKLRRIAVEATEQNDSIYVPDINEVEKIDALMKQWDKGRLILFCDENGGRNLIDLKTLIKKHKKIAIFIGPIGGWSQNDRNCLEKNDIVKIGLGQNILKADTAAIYSLSCLKALLR